MKIFSTLTSTNQALTIGIIFDPNFKMGCTDMCLAMSVQSVIFGVTLDLFFIYLIKISFRRLSYNHILCYSIKL